MSSVITEHKRKVLYYYKGEAIYNNILISESLGLDIYIMLTSSSREHAMG